MTAVLTALNHYPIKSAGGTSLASADLTATGVRHDREFMLVTPQRQHISQRELPALALLRPTYDGEILTVTRAGSDHDPLVHKPVDDDPVDVSVHRTRCLGIDQGDEAATWFTGALGKPCRLMRFTGTRPTKRGGGQVAYADGYPLLLISAESLTDLNARLDVPLPMNRFRPNLVVEGLGPYGEDDVRRLRIGDTEIELVKPCTRCVITTTDQDTAERGREPLRTLATYRTLDGGIRFGQNAVIRTPGPLTIGTPAEPLT